MPNAVKNEESERKHRSGDKKSSAKGVSPHLILNVKRCICRAKFSGRYFNHPSTTTQPSFVSNPRTIPTQPTKPQPNDATRNGHKSVLQSPLRAKCSLIRGRFRSCAERLCLVCRIFNKRLLAWRIPKPPDFHPHHVVVLERGEGNMV